VSYRIAKRALDIMGALAGMTILALLWPAIALAIWLDSPGPVLFRQARPGLGKRPFWLYKFRTMYRDAEMRLPQLLGGQVRRNPILIDIPNDPRVTRVGRLLRRTSLDELPQFINILLGQMSLVGPRPFSRALYSDHPLLRARFLVRPGLTGLWQINGRKNTTFDEALMLDLKYVRRCCIWEDLRIILRTVPAILRTRGAR
jgi:lipopolysaccharide/colanic/teichoic acid biosynthesis glycosyltransferase